jgi:Leucine-rich repeat (LRR) protein
VALIFSVVLAAIWFSAIAGVVNFPDPGLEAAVREAIGRLMGDILESDLVGLTTLDAEDRGISDLTGIEYCVDLTWLHLSGNQIVDITPLAGLINLTKLWLKWNDIFDISPLVENSTVGGLPKVAK